MKRGSKYQYAQLPVFAYQVFDPRSLRFSNVPIITPDDRPPITDDEIADTYWKSVAAPDSDPEQDLEILEDLESGADPSDQHFTDDGEPEAAPEPEQEASPTDEPAEEADAQHSPPAAEETPSEAIVDDVPPAAEEQILAEAAETDEQIAEAEQNEENAITEPVVVTDDEPNGGDDAVIVVGDAPAEDIGVIIVPPPAPDPPKPKSKKSSKSKVANIVASYEKKEPKKEKEKEKGKSKEKEKEKSKLKAKDTLKEKPREKANSKKTKKKKDEKKAAPAPEVMEPAESEIIVVGDADASTASDHPNIEVIDEAIESNDLLVVHEIAEESATGVQEEESPEVVNIPEDTDEGQDTTPGESNDVTTGDSIEELSDPNSEPNPDVEEVPAAPEEVEDKLTADVAGDDATNGSEGDMPGSFPDPPEGPALTSVSAADVAEANIETEEKIKEPAQETAPDLDSHQAAENIVESPPTAEGEENKVEIEPKAAEKQEDQAADHPVATEPGVDKTDDSTEEATAGISETAQESTNTGPEPAPGSAPGATGADSDKVEDPQLPTVDVPAEPGPEVASEPELQSAEASNEPATAEKEVDSTYEQPAEGSNNLTGVEGAHTAPVSDPEKIEDVPKEADVETIPSQESGDKPIEVAEAPVVAPVEAPAETPAEETAGETAGETAEPPAEAPAEPPAEAPAEKTTDETAEPPAEPPAEPAEPPTETSTDHEQPEVDSLQNLQDTSGGPKDAETHQDKTTVPVVVFPNHDEGNLAATDDASTTQAEAPAAGDVTPALVENAAEESKDEAPPVDHMSDIAVLDGEAPESDRPEIATISGDVIAENQPIEIVGEADDIAVEDVLLEPASPSQDGPLPPASTGTTSSDGKRRRRRRRHGSDRQSTSSRPNITVRSLKSGPALERNKNDRGMFTNTFAVAYANEIERRQPPSGKRHQDDKESQHRRRHRRGSDRDRPSEGSPKGKGKATDVNDSYDDPSPPTSPEAERPATSPTPERPGHRRRYRSSHGANAISSNSDGKIVLSRRHTTGESSLVAEVGGSGNSASGHKRSHRSHRERKPGRESTEGKDRDQDRDRERRRERTESDKHRPRDLEEDKVGRKHRDRYRDRDRERDTTEGKPTISSSGGPDSKKSSQSAAKKRPGSGSGSFVGALKSFFVPGSR